MNLTYDITAAFDEYSTRNGSLSKLLEARFCSTRASAAAANVAGSGAPAAGLGSATATAPAATTTTAMNVRAQGARRGETDKLRGSQPAGGAAPERHRGSAATVLRTVHWFDHAE